MSLKILIDIILMSLYYNSLNQLNLNVPISGILVIDVKQNNKSTPEILIQNKVDSHMFSPSFSQPSSFSFNLICILTRFSWVGYL